MRIDCPACAAAYEVPESLLDTKRPLRCARCGHQWLPWAPPEPAPPPEASPPELEPWSPIEPDLPATLLEVPLATVRGAAPDFETEPDPQETYRDEFLSPDPAQRLSPEAPGGGGLAIRLAWAATVLLIALLIWGGYAWRGDVMRIWPASERLYAALGLLQPEP